MKKQRAVFRIQLTNDAKKRLLDLSDRLGITQIALTSRLTEWFASQPDLIQAAVLGLYPDVIKQDVAQLILKRMADGKTAAPAKKSAEPKEPAAKKGR